MPDEMPAVLGHAFRPFFILAAVYAVVLVTGWLGYWHAAIPASVWVHAIGVGAMGTLILGVMTRVLLGHTGRALKLPPGAALIYVSITLAALLRVASASGWTDPGWALPAAGACWVLAFVLFLAWYVPILIAPRADGRPG